MGYLLFGYKGEEEDLKYWYEEALQDIWFLYNSKCKTVYVVNATTCVKEQLK